jgi:hypothetical protein
VLELIPRKVTADDEWYATVVPTVRSFITYTASKGLLHRGSAPIQQLLREMNSIDAEFDEAVHDSSRFGMAKSIFTRMGVDPEALANDPAALQDVMDRFNALPMAERKAVTDPAMRGGAIDLRTGDPRTIDLGSVEPEPGARVLPAVRLAPAAELAAAVRSAPVIRDLVRLAGWLGAGRAVTSTGVLTLKETKDVVQALGWQDAGQPALTVRSARDLPQLNLLWQLAAGAGVIEIAPTRARPGPAHDMLLSLDDDSPGADELALSLWQLAFESALEWVIAPDDRDDDLQDESLGYGVIHALLSDYAGDTHTVGQLVDELDEFDEFDVDEFDLDEATTETISASLRTVAAHRVRQLLKPFADLGAVAAVDDDADEVLLSPLGVAGVRRFAIGQGYDAPLAADVAGLNAAEALDQIMAASLTLSDELAREWFAARPQVQGVAEMLDLARECSASKRFAVLTMLDDTLEDGLPSLAPVVTHDPLVGPVLRAFIVEREAVHALMTGLDDALSQVGPDPSALERLRLALHGFGWLDGDFSRAERDLLIVETYARALDGLTPPVRSDDLEPAVWEQVDDVAVPRLATSGHPDAVLVLDALGTGHPIGRVRKAAKKAAHKHRLALKVIHR